METKAWAQVVRAFDRYLSVDGTAGVTESPQFKNGLYVGTGIWSFNHAIHESGSNELSSTSYAVFSSTQLRFKQTVGDEVSSGILDYGNIDANSLGIVGKGTLSGNRTVKIYDRLQNDVFFSGYQGWSLNYTGDAEFNNVRVRGELAASVFKVNEITATGGTVIVSKSASTVYASFTTPASTGSSVTALIKNTDDGFSLFQASDIVRIKSWVGTGIGDAWFTVASVGTNSGAYTSYSLTLRSGSTSTTFSAGTAIADYGTSGYGIITLSTDGALGSSPNLSMALINSTPWAGGFTALCRLGNLNGYGDYGTAYGLTVGDPALSWLCVDSTNGFRVRNGTTTLGQWDTSGNVAFGRVATNKANVYWNASNSRLEFRGGTAGTVVQSYIDIDGSFVAGAGNLVIDSTGVRLGNSAAYAANATVKWYDPSITPLASTYYGEVYSYSDAGFSQMSIRSGQHTGTASGNSSVQLIAVNNLGKTAQLNLLSEGSTYAFGNANNTLATISGDNFVGVTIGSGNQPLHMLDVNGTGWFSNKVSIGTTNGATQSYFLTVKGGNDNEVLIDNAGTQYTSMYFANSGTLKGQIFYDNTSTRFGIGGAASGVQTVLFYGASQSGLVVSSAGAIRFPTYGAGTLVTDASGNITASSDERLKTNIRKFRKGLREISKLEPIIHRWNKRSGLDRKNNYVGFGARHTRKHIPEAVGKSPDGFATMSDRAILAALVNAVQELDKRTR